jgi:hypothetical protein
MFAYQCLSEESVRWQEEEVQWGEFVPYDVVEVAAALSIDRLVGGAYWPGGIPSSEGVQLNEKIDYVKKQYANDQAWETWDFVPDGLLVWEAWLKWFKSRVV